jgi:hypothetical protein
MQATAALVEAGVQSEPLARRYATVDAQLALAVAAWFPGRLADKSLPAVRKVTAFLTAILDDPVRAGFVQQPGGSWQPPPDGQASARAKTSADRQAATAQGRQRYLQGKAASEFTGSRGWLWMNQWLAAWDRLEDGQRQAIRAEVRLTQPLYASTDNEDYTFKRQCLIVLEAWSQSGRLNPLGAKPDGR